MVAVSDDPPGGGFREVGAQDEHRTVRVGELERVVEHVARDDRFLPLGADPDAHVAGCMAGGGNQRDLFVDTMVRLDVIQATVRMPDMVEAEVRLVPTDCNRAKDCKREGIRCIVYDKDGGLDPCPEAWKGEF